MTTKTTFRPVFCLVLIVTAAFCSVLIVAVGLLDHDLRRTAEAQQPAWVRSHYFHALVKTFEKHSGAKYWNFEKRRATTAGMIQEAGMDHGGEDMRVDAGRFVALAQNLIGDDNVDGKWYAQEIKKTVLD